MLLHKDFSHKPKKRWGQVFLKNDHIKKKIAGFVNGSEYETVLEIGPGLGAITQFIDFKAKKYIALEIDASLARHLGFEYPDAQIIAEDFLDYEFNPDLNGEVTNIKSALLFGNIPYYISTPIIVKFLKSKMFPRAYLMVQKEYFEMLKAEFCTKQYSSFSVLLQTCCKVSKLISINRLNFFPKPNVDSIFLEIKKKDTPILSEFDLFSDFLRICFAMPRKTLYNNLRKVVQDIPLIESLYSEHELKSNIRPQEISPELFEKIFLSLNSSWRLIINQRKTVV